MKAIPLIARKGVTLNLKVIRSLGLTWGQREDGVFLMTKEGWAAAELAKAVLPTP